PRASGPRAGRPPGPGSAAKRQGSRREHKPHAHETSGRGTCEHVQALSSLTRLAPPTPTVTEAETLDMLRSILRTRLGGKQRLKRHQVNQTSRRRVAGVTARVPLATQERFAAFLYQSDSGGQVCCGSAAVAAARSAAASSAEAMASRTA
ncbi:hypothetical protein THAOC_29817, partial [Thalassiosira oceanica]